MTDRERLTLLEERYAHLQRHVAEQDRAMLALGDELAKVRKELAMLRARMVALPEPDGGASAEKPPHY